MNPTRDLSQPEYKTARIRRNLKEGRSFLEDLAIRYHNEVNQEKNTWLKREPGLQTYKTLYAYELDRLCPWGEAGTWRQE